MRDASGLDPVILDNEDDSQNIFFRNEDDNSCSSSIHDESDFERKKSSEILEEKLNGASKSDSTLEQAKKQSFIYSIKNMLSSEKEQKSNDTPTDSSNDNFKKNDESIRDIALHET